MKLLIIDNEKHIRALARKLIETLCPAIEQIEEAVGVEDGLSKINTFQPEIILLDVEMDDGTGFDLMKQIPNPTSQLIFFTAHNKYAIDAFQLNAIDYLLKPIDPIALQKAIHKALENIRQKDLQKQIHFLLQYVSGQHDAEKRIVLKDMTNIYYVKISEICYCEAEGTYTKFRLSEGNTIIVSKNMKEYETLLSPFGFIRCHNSYMVNAEKIIRYDKTGNLVLEGNYEVNVSFRKKEQILKLIEKKSWNIS
ncbi:MAG: response regulator transcription factor [Chitinophagaceae bacterium]|nr:response regulator transcription factor [Chitinophagaceae bacterium]